MHSGDIMAEEELRPTLRSIADLLDDFTDPPPKGTESELDALLDDGVSELTGTATVPKSPPPPVEEDDKTRKLSKLSLPEKRAQAWEYRMRGIPVSAVAAAFGVDQKTIHQWISDYVKEYRSTLEQESAANLIAESFLYLGNIEDLCMYEITQIASETGAPEIDPKTGAVKKSNLNIQAKGVQVKFLQTALKARQMKLELGMATGVLPKEPERIYHTMADAKPAVAGVEDVSAEKSPEALKQSILELLTRARKLT